jgi:cytochrome c oxidase cbb3-type subunit 1
MDWFAKAFLKASLAWLGAGVTLGIAMAMYPAWAVYRTAHLHMNLLGFVAMMIFGVAYHVIPRFTGHPLHSRRLATAQWWLANAGLVLLVGGFALLPNTRFGAPARAVVAVGGTLSAVAAYVFIYNLWRTIDGDATARAADRASVRARRASVARRLPVSEPAASGEAGAALSADRAPR